MIQTEKLRKAVPKKFAEFEEALRHILGADKDEVQKKIEVAEKRPRGRPRKHPEETT
jgi:hypothetical protein